VWQGDLNTLLTPRGFPPVAPAASFADEAPLFEKVKPVQVAEVLRSLGNTQKAHQPAAPMSMVDTQSETVLSFSLSVWRPQSELLVIDARHTQLALPTELLLNNILKAVLGETFFLGNEEVIHWPFVGSPLINNTKESVGNALQVWLEVELERRPTKFMLAFGLNAIQYFISDQISYQDNLWQRWPLSFSSTQVIVFPSLVDLLQQPLLKRNLWQCLMTHLQR
jgi:DNA polymerase III psi subunit